MKTLIYNTKDEWLSDRRGRITGSKLGDLYSKKGIKKIEYYQLIADKLGIPADDESPMDRGTRLEGEAIQEFMNETGKEVDTSLVMWTRDDNDDIAYSPDGFIGEEEVVEVKCLGLARHIEAWLTKKIPKDYEEQVRQAFVVNEKLNTLYFVFYDPRLEAKPFFYFTINRVDIQEDIDEFLAFERQTLEEISIIIKDLTF